MDSKCCEQIELEGLIRWRHTPLPHACYFPANPLPPRNTSRIKINNSCSPNLEGTREHTDTERLTRLQKKPPPPETIRCASLAAFSQKQHQTRLPGKNRPDCFILSAVKIKLFFFPDVWLLCWVFSPSLLVLQVISVFPTGAHISARCSTAADNRHWTWTACSVFYLLHPKNVFMSFMFPNFMLLFCIFWFPAQRSLDLPWVHIK